jgi:hypothetical protein
MLSGLRNLAGRIARRNWYPILIPYFRIVDGAMSSRPRDLAEAMALCDGTRTLSDVAAAAGIAPGRFLVEEAAGGILLWPEPLPPPVVPRSTPPLPQIIISPHLDDAALSVGRLMLARSPLRKIVVDVFSTVSWWRFDLNADVLPRVQAARDAEEELVMRLTQCELRRWGLAEAPLRGYPLKEIFIAERLPEASETHAIIRDKIIALAREQQLAFWFLPLGIGNHIDHRIARDAAIEALESLKVDPGHILFYEDLPYAAQDPELRDYTGFLEAVMPGRPLKPLFSFSGHKRTHALKQRLLRVYWSQLTPSQLAGVGAYARSFGRGSPKERMWWWVPQGSGHPLRLTD